MWDSCNYVNYSIESIFGKWKIDINENYNIIYYIYTKFLRIQIWNYNYSIEGIIGKWKIEISGNYNIIDYIFTKFLRIQIWNYN